MTVTIPVWLLWTLGIAAGAAAVVIVLSVLSLAYFGFMILWNWSRW